MLEVTQHSDSESADIKTSSMRADYRLVDSTGATFIDVSKSVDDVVVTHVADVQAFGVVGVHGPNLCWRLLLCVVAGGDGVVYESHFDGVAVTRRRTSPRLVSAPS